MNTVFGLWAKLMKDSEIGDRKKRDFVHPITRAKREVLGDKLEDWEEIDSWTTFEEDDSWFCTSHYRCRNKKTSEERVVDLVNLI